MLCCLELERHWGQVCVLLTAAAGVSVKSHNKPTTRLTSPGSHAWLHRLLRLHFARCCVTLVFYSSTAFSFALSPDRSQANVWCFMFPCHGRMRIACMVSGTVLEASRSSSLAISTACVVIWIGLLIVCVNLHHQALFGAPYW